MAISLRLRTYLSMERSLIDLEDAGDELAEHLRDSMDNIWQVLSAEERFSLNIRFGEPQIFAGGVGVLKHPTSERRDIAARVSARSHFLRLA